MSKGPFVAMVAGETSGDLLAGLILPAMHERWSELEACGIGGSHMEKAGFNSWWPSEKLAVRGYVEVLRHYREIVGIRTQLKERLLKCAPQLFIGIDAPDFNLDLENALKKKGIKTLHFVSPSVWAWRAERVEKIRQSVDHVLCVFPFEVELLQKHGIPATYVGHPLANVIPIEADRTAARKKFGLDNESLVVAILPGSRRSEIQYLAFRFFQAVSLIQKENDAIKFIVPAIPALLEEIQSAARNAGVFEAIQWVKGQSHAVLAACDVTLIASGTATLEAALFKRPMVIAYNMNFLSWQIMRRQKLQPWVGLPNILCEEFVVPEFLQDQATPQALAQAVLGWLQAPEKICILKNKFSDLHLQLQRDTPRLATDAIEKILQG